MKKKKKEVVGVSTQPNSSPPLIQEDRIASPSLAVADVEVVQVSGVGNFDESINYISNLQNFIQKTKKIKMNCQTKSINKELPQYEFLNLVGSGRARQKMSLQKGVVFGRVTVVLNGGTVLLECVVDNVKVMNVLKSKKRLKKYLAYLLLEKVNSLNYVLF